MKLQLKDVCFAVGQVQILNNIDLDLPSGSCSVLLGPNGAGKSTVMRVASGIERPSSGLVNLNDKPVHDMSLGERARHLGVLTQRNSLDFPFTAGEVVAMGRTPYGISGRDQTTDTIISALGIDASQIYTHLSGGEKQLVQLARVFSQVWQRGEDACVLLDEPMTALDLNHQKEVVGLLRKFSSEGTSQLIVMHDINLAAEVADHIVLMKKGGIVASGLSSDILTADALSDTFETPMSVLQDGDQRFYKTQL